MSAAKVADQKIAETGSAVDDVESLSSLSGSDVDFENMEPVSGDWQYLKTPEKVKEKRREVRRRDSRGEEKTELSLEERVAAELEASVGERRTPRRQNTTLEDFFASPKRAAASKSRPNSKRNASPRAIVSPPHKAHRILSPKRKENRSTGRFIREVCQKLNEPKHNLMRRVLEQTGKVFVLDLLDQVEKVEEQGGQFVADGTRRRTKGGVFLNLLKSHVSKDQWDTIFEDEKEALKRRKAMKRRLRYTADGASQGENQGGTPKTGCLPLSYKECLTKLAT